MSTAQDNQAASRRHKTNLINRRIAAFLVESAIAVPCTALLAALVRALLPPDQVATALEEPALLVLITLTVYLVLRDVIGGGTSLGKSSLGLRVLRQDGSPAGMAEASLRTLPWVFPPLAVLEYTWAMLFDAEQRRIGDRLAGTRVEDASEGRLMESSFTGQSLFALLFFVGSFLVTMHIITWLQ